MNKYQQHLSRAGFEKFKAEWEDLKYKQRPEMQKQVQIAAAEGDRSENAAYTFGKMKLRDIDRRLKYLDRIIDNAIIVDEVVQDGSARFGARVVMQNLQTSKEIEYILVGKAESDVLNGKIAVNSPFGKSLIGKRPGDKVEIKSPRGPQHFQVLKVEYDL